jgi:NAD(P) transhydrogenase subunit alpha
MIVGVPAESHPGEARVALVPGVVPELARAGLSVLVEPGAGARAGYGDDAYQAKGARLAGSRAQVFGEAAIVVQVRTYGASPKAGRTDLPLLSAGQLLVGLSDPLTSREPIQALAAAGVSLAAMELIPRITRAQSMDALSSMATVAGYKAVLLAAAQLPRLFPMMMTAAGTVAPTKVFVIGAGVAGLQACATARRLGAVVSAYDVRPAAKEQVESVGARFVQLAVEADGSEAQGGYARALGEDFYRRQRELMQQVVAASDVVITTAAVPGKRSPVLVTRAMVEAMAPGSVIVDLAAERGGNCELTLADEAVEHRGVTILGPTNLPATVPFHASQLYGKNVAALLVHLVRGGQLALDASDEIAREVLVLRRGELVHPRVVEALGLGAKAGG